MTVHFLYTEEHAQEVIDTLFSQNHSIRQIAEFLEGDWKPMDIWRVIKHGEFPQTPKKRARCKLFPLIKVPPCPECGELHVIGECTQGKTVVVKPRRNGKPRRRQPPNVYIGYTTDEERAAIMALTPDERKRRLLDDVSMAAEWKHDALTRSVWRDYSTG